MKTLRAIFSDIGLIFYGVFTAAVLAGALAWAVARELVRRGPVAFARWANEEHD